MRTIGMLAVMLTTAGTLSAQSVESGRAGAREVLLRTLEMDLARSAAPPTVSQEATVLLWNGNGFDVGHEGSNGVTCYVARSWPDSLEPHCFDEEGACTILPDPPSAGGALEPKQERRGDLGGDRRGSENRRISAAAPPVMSYMMSAGQELISDESQPAGAWRGPIS